MGFAEFNPNVKKVNLKPKGEVEIVLTASLSDLRGSVETLSDMIDQKVRVALDSTIVTYNVQINARTEKPIKSYRVDEQGIVSEIKPEGEQVELDLGLPKDKLPIEEVREEIDRTIVDEFILALLAPDYDDLPYPFYSWVLNLTAGYNYSMIAKNVSDLLDEYRGRIAPLAAAWDKWRQEKAEKPAIPADDDADASKANADPDPDRDLEDVDEDDELSEFERKIVGEDDQEPKPKTEHDDSADAGGDIESYILQAKPAFPDIPYDFPTLLHRRKSGETWMQIAGTLGVRSTQLAAAYSKYKKRIKEQRGDGAA